MLHVESHRRMHNYSVIQYFFLCLQPLQLYLLSNKNTRWEKKKSFFPTRITRYVTSHKPISRFNYFLKQTSPVSEILALNLGFDAFPDVE